MSIAGRRMKCLAGALLTACMLFQAVWTEGAAADQGTDDSGTDVFVVLPLDGSEGEAEQVADASSKTADSSGASGKSSGQLPKTGDVGGFGIAALACACAMGAVLALVSGVRATERRNRLRLRMTMGLERMAAGGDDDV